MGDGEVGGGLVVAQNVSNSDSGVIVCLALP
jgi:hypothetical protein